MAEGKLLLDEASAAALAGELDPFSTLVVYCNTIGACRDVADFESAGEAERASDFCDTNTMNAFPGMCRVNHAEVMKFKGRLTEAHELADRAGEELRVWNPRIAGAAFYELGEVRLRLGELAQAEQAFREADEFGRTPEPGLSLLRLAQGNAQGAFASIRRAATTTRSPFPAQARSAWPSSRSPSRPRRTEQAAGYAERLAAIGEAYDTSALTASAAFARGQVALARGEVDAVFHEFRHARMTWDSTSATYDVARAREQLGRALRAGATRMPPSGSCRRRRATSVSAPSETPSGAELLHARNVHRGDEDLLYGHRRLDRAGKRRRSDRHWVNLLRRHDETLRAIFANFNGQVVDHTGDGFFAAFEEAPEAIGAAIAIQRAVDQEFEFDIRIGVHTDGALQTNQNYHGKGVHAAARIGAAAEGQEILASKETVAGLPQFEVTSPRSLSLKGFKKPVEVCSVSWR